MEKIGRYLIQQEIGQGGMATVYLAQDPKIKREVAIKLFKHEDFKHNKTKLDLFYKEAEAAGKLTHPNIVIIYDIGEEKGIPYIVMEYLEGKSLARLLEQSYHFSLQDSLDITIQLCSALEYAHKKGIVHRDIKPGNIILLTDGSIKLTDFGIAKVMGSSSKKDSGSKIGTPGYMSLEQIDGKAVDFRTDIFSSGVIFYELLTGERAFKGKTLEEIRRKIIKMDLIPPSQKRREIPVEIDEIVFKAISRNPEKRYQNIIMFKEQLQKIKKLQGRKKETKKNIVRIPSIPNGPIPLENEIKTTPISKKRGLSYPNLIIAAIGVSIIILIAVLSYLSVNKEKRNNNEKNLNYPIINKASTISPEGSNLNSIIREANYNLKSGKYERAKELYNKVLQKDNKNPKAYYGLAEVMFNQELYFPAIDNYNKALEFDPTMAKAHLMKAKSYYKEYVAIKDKKYLDMALQSCQKAIEVNPRLKEAIIFNNFLRKELRPSSKVFTLPKKTPSAQPQIIKKKSTISYGYLSINTIPYTKIFMWPAGKFNAVIKNETTPLSKRVPTGNYKIRYLIEATGEMVEEYITVDKNDQSSPMTIKKIFMVKVNLNSTPAATIVIDNNTQVDTPTTISLYVGCHTFVAIRNGQTKTKEKIIKYYGDNTVYFVW